MIDEPTPSPPARSRRGRIELVTAGFFAVLMLGVLAGLPRLREAIVEGARAGIDRVLPAAWTAYYLEADELFPTAGTHPEATDSRLMFASGSLPGRAARLLAAPVFSGGWSPNGERFAASSGTRVLLGDRDGQVRPLADLGDLHPTAPAMWSGDDQMLVPVTRDGGQQWIVRLDSRSGTILDQRDIAVELAPYAASPDGKWVVALNRRNVGTTVLHEIATGRRIDPAPGEAFAAWLADGRVLVSVEDATGAHLAARRPDGGAPERLLELEGAPLLPAGSSGGRVAIVVAQTREPTGPRSIWAITPGEAPKRVARDLEGLHRPTPSRDGRYVGFSEQRPGAPATIRTGAIEVATGRIIYACEAGCAVLDLR